MSQLLELLTEYGVHAMPDAMAILLNHAMKAERTAVLGAEPYARSENRKGYANGFKPKIHMRKEVASDIRTIFNAVNPQEALERKQKVVLKYQNTAPTLCGWLEENIEQSLTVLKLPIYHRMRLRTTNSLERINRELKRRTKVASLFPNEASLLRLASAVLAEIDEDWQTDPLYLPMENPAFDKQEQFTEK